MFGSWLRKRRNKKRHKARLIFHFWDGSDERGADPLEIMRRIADHPKFLAEKHIVLAVGPPEGTPDVLVNEATEICCGAARDVFDIEQFRELNGFRIGLNTDELLGLWTTFAEYIDALKKNGSGLPILPNSTDRTPSPPTSSPATNAPSDSSSTVPAEPIAEVPAS